MSYFISCQDQVYGPYSEADVSAFLSQGRVRLSDLARTEGMRQWAPLHTVFPPTLVNSAGASGVPQSGQCHQWTYSTRPLPRPVICPHPVSPQGNALNWPFLQKDWFDSLWMPLLWWFPFPMLPLGGFVSVGWIMDAARRRSSGQLDVLPRSPDCSRFMREGFAVAAFFLLYIIVPMFAITWWASINPFSFVVTVGRWLLNHFEGVPNFSLGARLGEQLSLYLVSGMVQFAYLIPAAPVFTAAVVRYAMTRKARSFFNLPACVAMVFGNPLAFVRFAFLSCMLVWLVLLTDGLLLGTVIGGVLIIPVGAAVVWVASYWFGELVTKVSPLAEIRAGKL